MALPDAYLTGDEADAFAVRVADAIAWTGASAEAQAAALVQASDEIDTVRFAGAKYDPDQGRQFPRWVEDPPSEWPAGKSAMSGHIWDLDAEGAVVVPERVKFAAFLQALAILADPNRSARLEDQHQGVTGQGAGGVSESYDPNRRPDLVCLAARRQLRPYLLRTGRPY